MMLSIFLAYLQEISIINFWGDIYHMYWNIGDIFPIQLLL